MKIKSDLTRQQTKVLTWIADYIEEHQFPPTNREISVFLTGKSSPSSADCHLQALKKKGYLTSNKNQARTLQLLKPAPGDSMTVEIRVTCSRCGTHLLKNRIMFEVWTGHVRHRKPALDLCERCYGDLQSWLGNTYTKPGSEETRPRKSSDSKEEFEVSIREAEEIF